MADFFFIANSPTVHVDLFAQLCARITHLTLTTERCCDLALVDIYMLVCFYEFLEIETLATRVVVVILSRNHTLYMHFQTIT